MLFLQQNLKLFLSKVHYLTFVLKAPHIVQDGQEKYTLYKNAVENYLWLCNSMKFRLDTTFCKFHLANM